MHTFVIVVNQAYFYSLLHSPEFLPSSSLVCDYWLFLFLSFSSEDFKVLVIRLGCRYYLKNAVMTA